MRANAWRMGRAATTLTESGLKVFSSILKFPVVHHVRHFALDAQLHFFTELGKKTNVITFRSQERFAFTHSHKDKLGSHAVGTRRTVISKHQTLAVFSFEIHLVFEYIGSR